MCAGGAGGVCRTDEVALWHYFGTHNFARCCVLLESIRQTSAHANAARSTMGTRISDTSTASNAGLVQYSCQNIV